MVDDLPVELWLEILSYLPRSALHKMMGLSRTTFELAMDDLYEELRFINDDKEARKMFQQLRYRGVNQRVRRLTIRPAFLPGMDEDPEETALRSKLSQAFTYVKHITLHPSSPLPVDWKDPASEVISLAQTSLKDCPNLRDVTIILHDLAITPLFATFLHTLLGSTSLGPRLTTLTIDTTLLKLPHLFTPLTLNASHLTSLQSLHICLSLSRFDPPEPECTKALQSISTFINHTSHQLSTINITSNCTRDISPLFRSFPILSSQFQRLEIRCVFSTTTIPKIRDLNDMIARQSDSLQSLALSHRGKHVTHTGSDHSFNHWLASCMPGTFSTLRLPHLRTLEVEVKEGYLRSYALPGSQESSLTKLYSIAPALTSLAIGGEYFRDQDVFDIIKGLPKKDGVCTLESLKIWVEGITCQLLDHVSETLPGLQSLELHFQSAFNAGVSPIFPSLSTHNPLVFKIRRCPLTPKYEPVDTQPPSFDTSESPHQAGHTAQSLILAKDVMKAVAETFPHNTRVNYEMECDCISDYRVY